LKTEGGELRKLLRQLFLLKVTLYLSLVIALGTTVFLIASSLFQLPTFGPLAPGPAAQKEVANATVATITSLFSTTVSREGGYGVASNPFISKSLNYYGFTALVSWVVFGAALIWRGRVRSVWGESRFSYETFRLLVKMRGAQTRIKLMHSLNQPKNKLQLATSLGIDWKAVDKHVQVLQKNGLIQTAATNGTATYYEVTEKGRSLLQVLEQLNADTASTTEPNS